jgi:hypothetical protein
MWALWDRLSIVLYCEHLKIFGKVKNWKWERIKMLRKLRSVLMDLGLEED